MAKTCQVVNEYIFEKRNRYGKNPRQLPGALLINSLIYKAVHHLSYKKYSLEVVFVNIYLN